MTVVRIYIVVFWVLNRRVLYVVTMASKKLCVLVIKVTKLGNDVRGAKLS
jgi:hypothetical protein